MSSSRGTTVLIGVKYQMYDAMPCLVVGSLFTFPCIRSDAIGTLGIAVHRRTLGPKSTSCQPGCPSPCLPLIFPQLDGQPQRRCGKQDRAQVPNSYLSIPPNPFSVNRLVLPDISHHVGRLPDLPGEHHCPGQHCCHQVGTPIIRLPVTQI